jgi:glycosyltransferase involved in cell wall biosynthesis
VSLREDPGTPCFIVFSDDWGRHPSSCQHLFRELALDHSALWVNTVGMRRPSLSLADCKEALLKLWGMLGSPRVPPEQGHAKLRLRVIQPFMLPYVSLRVIRSINRYFVCKAIRRASMEMQLRLPIIVTTVPNACDYVDCVESRRIVYYCVDDFARWPGLEHDLVRQMESQLIERADVFVCTSKRLMERMTAAGKPVHLLSHGVDLELFADVPQGEHKRLAQIPRPRAGYFGLIDQRSDLDLIARVASAVPDFSFVLTGPVVTDVSTLRDLKNVYLTGPVAYAELPSLVKGFAVLILPYTVNELTDSISPLKLKEYLLTGKPVLSTPLAEVMPLQDCVTVVSSAGAWPAALRSALTVDSAGRRTKMAAKLAHEGWRVKAVEFLRMCSCSTR